MDYKYFVCVTDEGRKLIANAIATETNIDFTHMSVGDANGTSYDPEPGMNALKHEVYKAEIGSIKTNAEDNNILEFEFIVPASSGGYYIREAALYAGETVCAIARLPEQYKAQASEGAGSSMTVKLLIAVTSDAKVYINIPESLQYATQTYVGERIKNHVDEDNPHTQYVKNETYTEGINELKNNKAEKTHNHDDIYSKLNHNHNDIYSQLNHNHELSSLNGVLPVNKGGTGLLNGFNSLNYIGDSRFFPFFRSGMSLDEFIKNLYEYTNLEALKTTTNPKGILEGIVYLREEIESVPEGVYANIIIEPVNSNTYFYTIFAKSFSNSTIYLYNSNEKKWVKFKEPFKYDGSNGEWIETVLSDGKTLLEGFSYVGLAPNAERKFRIPKNISSKHTLQVTVSTYYNGKYNYNEAFGGIYDNHIYIKNSEKSTETTQIYWYFKGILA